MDFETTKGLRQTKITKRLVDSLRPKDEVYSVWDHEVPGFGVRVMTTGRKSFVLKYSINRMQRWITLGRYGDLTVDEARKLAQTRRGEVAKGLDPTVDLRARRSAPTISELIERFIAEHVEVKTRKSTAEGYTRYLHNVIEPKLGKLLVRDLSPDEVAKFHHGLKNTPRQANQAVVILSKMLNCAEVWNYRPLSSNPCMHIEKFPEMKRERYLQPNELEALGLAMVEAERNKTIQAQVVAALRLLILTGTRHQEIASLRWDQVDLERKFLYFAPKDHKSGGTMGAKSVPLNPQAIEILANIPRILGNPYVVPGKNPGRPITSLQDSWERIRDRVSAMESEKVAAKKESPDEAVNIEDVRIHDLRHTFASVGVSQGLSLPVVGSLLGHSQPSVTQRYAHLAEDPRIDASEQIASTLARSLGTTKRSKKA